MKAVRLEHSTVVPMEPWMAVSWAGWRDLMWADCSEHWRGDGWVAQKAENLVARKGERWVESTAFLMVVWTECVKVVKKAQPMVDMLVERMVESWVACSAALLVSLTACYLAAEMAGKSAAQMVEWTEMHLVVQRDCLTVGWRDNSKVVCSVPLQVEKMVAWMADQLVGSTVLRRAAHWVPRTVVLTEHMKVGWLGWLRAENSDVHLAER